MNDDEVLFEVKWTVADVKNAFYEEYDREPTQEELSACISEIDWESIEEDSIERAWNTIQTAVSEALPL